MKRTPDNRVTEHPKGGPETGMPPVMSHPHHMIGEYVACSTSRNGAVFHPETMGHENLQFGTGRSHGSILSLKRSK